MILRFVVTTKCCSLSLHISLCGGTCAAVRQSAVHRPGPATMALFRSDILNQELFRRAVQAAERTASVEILELTIGEARTGLQVSEASVPRATCPQPRVAGGGAGAHHGRGPRAEARVLLDCEDLPLGLGRRRAGGRAEAVGEGVVRLQGTAACTGVKKEMVTWERFLNRLPLIQCIKVTK